MRSMAQGIVICFRAHCRAAGGRPRHALRVVPRAERGGAPSYRTATAYVRQEGKSILGLFSALQLSRSRGEQWFVRHARRNDRPAVAEVDICCAYPDGPRDNQSVPAGDLVNRSRQRRRPILRHPSSGAMRENRFAVKNKGVTP